MKHDAHPFDRSFSRPRLLEVGLNKFHFAVTEMTADILQLSAAEIVDHPNLGAALDQDIEQMRADEGGSSCQENFSPVPIHC